MADRIDPQHPQHSPSASEPHPAAPIPPAAEQALARLERAFPTPATVAEAASRYRQAAAHLRDLATHGDYEGCEYVRDEMAMCHCQLAAAGRLDLIGAQS